MARGHFMKALATIVGLSTLGLAAGCFIETNEGPGTGKTHKFPKQENFCVAVAEVVCNDAVVGACYGSDDETLEADRSKCVTARSQSAVCNPLAYPYQPEGAEACVAAHKDAYADAGLSRAEFDELEEACLAVFTRKGAENATCSVDADCDTAADLRCIIRYSELGDPTAHCAVPVIQGGGQECVGPNDVCDGGFYCNGDNCIAKPGETKACSGMIKPCADGLQCVDELCVAKLENGSPCAADDECKGTFCIKATGSETGSCSAKYTLAATSQTCGDFR